MATIPGGGGDDLIGTQHDDVLVATPFDDYVSGLCEAARTRFEDSRQAD